MFYFFLYTCFILGDQSGLFHSSTTPQYQWTSIPWLIKWHNVEWEMVLWEIKLCMTLDAVLCSCFSSSKHENSPPIDLLFLSAVLIICVCVLKGLLSWKFFFIISLVFLQHCLYWLLKMLLLNLSKTKHFYSSTKKTLQKEFLIPKSKLDTKKLIQQGQYILKRLISKDEERSEW